MNLRIGRISRWLSPGYSSCLRCKTTWRFSREHVTDYLDAIPANPPIQVGRVGKGCFPLCEQCWAELSPAERLPYYRALMERWHPNEAVIRDPDWTLIKQAVLAGR